MAGEEVRESQDVRAWRGYGAFQMVHPSKGLISIATYIEKLPDPSKI